MTKRIYDELGYSATKAAMKQMFGLKNVPDIVKNTLHEYPQGEWKHDGEGSWVLYGNRSLPHTDLRNKK